MTPSPDSDFQSRLSYSARALGLLLAGGVSLGFALGIAILPGSMLRYFQENHLASNLRHILLGCIVGGGAAAVLVGVLYLFTHFGTPNVTARLYHAARRLAPLYLVGFFALLFRCEVWKGRDLTFLALVALFGLAGWAAVTAAMHAGPFAWEARILSRLRGMGQGIARVLPRTSSSLPFILVVVGAAVYACYFGYYTYCFYYSLRSGYDLGIYDSLVWNMMHGGSYFKAPPWSGPGHSHFGNHSEFIAYALLPIYALRPNGGTLLLIQAAALGGAAIPLYKLARRHIDRWPACILALSYLLYPALHGENLFEFHFICLAPFLLWWAWYFLESRRNGWAALFVLLTLAVREDVTTWVAVLGAYFLLSGRRPKAGILLAVVGTLCCFSLKFVAMPYVGGRRKLHRHLQGLDSARRKGLWQCGGYVAGQSRLHHVHLGRDEQAHLYAPDSAAPGLSATAQAHRSSSVYSRVLLHRAVDAIRSPSQHLLSIQRPLDRIPLSWRSDWA